MLPHFLTLSLSFLLACSSSFSTAAWTGEYQDNTFGGSLYVCLSEVTEVDSSITTVAQGVFSKFGYLRGEVTGNEWQGEFFMAGIEARHGSFSFTLAADGMSYSGMFTESAGFSYSMGGDLVSSLGAVPKDTDCFKSDEYLLMKNVAPYSYTSNAIATNIAR
jgi:hypothetical protein